MNKITRKQLDQILADHRLWLDSNRKSGKPADLSGVDLRQADLSGADLRGADLSGANLQGANLRGANLSGVDLRRANLYRADLRWANLHRADLQGANLRGANLTDADLCGANLPLSIRDCFSFRYTKFSPEALPWLILHPQWPKWKDSVQIEAE
jgi:hypothetical protein